MAKILDGKKLAKELESRLLHDINYFTPKVGRSPGLGVIRVGGDPASGVYVSNKEKACKRVGIKSFMHHLNSDISESKILETINVLNNDKNVDGILLQLPLPDGINSSPLLKAIDPNKRKLEASLMIEKIRAIWPISFT